MPALESLHDTPEADRLRADQDDPWVMYLVVHRDRPVALDAMLGAAARATVDAYGLADDPRYAAAFRVWTERSFRKVCLRATEREWPRVLELPAGSGSVGGVEVVRALPPRLRSAREKLLARLQALTVLPDGDPVAVESPEGSAPVLVFLVNATVPMRAGKLVAQVAHAVLMAVGALGPRCPEAFSQWDAAGRPCAALWTPPEAWTLAAEESPCVVVRDAGLTEVTPGSRTVMALAPLPRSGWSATLRALRPVEGMTAATEARTETVTDPSRTR